MIMEDFVIPEKVRELTVTVKGAAPFVFKSPTAIAVVRVEGCGTALRIIKTHTNDRVLFFLSELIRIDYTL